MLGLLFFALIIGGFYWVIKYSRGTKVGKEPSITDMPNDLSYSPGLPPIRKALSSLLLIIFIIAAASAPSKQDHVSFIADNFISNAVGEKEITGLSNIFGGITHSIIEDVLEMEMEFKNLLVCTICSSRKLEIKNNCMI